MKGEIFEPKRSSYYEKAPVESDYQKAKKIFRATPTYTTVSNQKSFDSSNTAQTTLDYGVGDRVRHMKFGDGTVTAVVAGGRDYEVTVDFDSHGTKKMFASFAKLKKIS